MLLLLITKNVKAQDEPETVREGKTHLNIRGRGAGRRKRAKSG